MAGKFNFGERRIPGFKKKVGAWDEPRRAATPIVSADVADIALMYFVEQMGLVAIGNKYGVGPNDIRKIVRGGNFHQDWSVAIADLIADGVVCVRSAEMMSEDRAALSGKLRPERLGAHEVRAIRQMHMDGLSLPEILAATGLSTFRVRRILRNEAFNKDNFKPPGWRKDTSNWRKDK